jgi:hypothetical protein
MIDHPYRNLPAHCFWRRGMDEVPGAEVDPVVRAKFTVRRSHLVATAGSCFAQHIARHLSASGFSYYVSETAHPIFPASIGAAYNYGTFTARYGNVYTSRQLIQMLRRAYGQFVPRDDIWRADAGRCYDPFRPQIQPDGFASEREYRLDRERHFAAIRSAIETMDVFVFTLGLTETWVSKEDGAAYPLCPGVAAGSFDPARHGFVNLRVAQVLGDMREALDFIRDRNQRVRFILTVSPVPLAATAEDRHVLVSTTYSKSVLRAVCGELEAQYEDVAYFPSYEIITGAHARSAYYGPDLRTVLESGVGHVMRLFMKHYAAEETIGEAAAPRAAATAAASLDAETRRVNSDAAAAVAVVCEEAGLDSA